MLSLLWLAVCSILWPLTTSAQSELRELRADGRTETRAERRHERQADASRRREPFSLPADVAALQPLSVVLGRPTASSVTASIVSQSAAQAYLEVGSRSGVYERQSELLTLAPGQPAHLLLERLPPNQRSYYRLRYRLAGNSSFSATPEYSLHTRRPPGSTFVFELQGDSHPERRQQFSPELYARTLRQVAADRPDFYLLLGDDFSVDTLSTINAATVSERYRLQRPFLSLLGHSSPLFLVNGNHEQAALANYDGSADNVAVWAQNARDAYFPQPAPDGFYSGNSKPLPHIGLLRNYYAWHWGDALLVVLDPYWHTPQPVDNVFGGGAKNRDLWAVTLGEAQYRWLQQTLAASQARYKFVFAHHVHGTGRGGIELAGLYEWGGRDRQGRDLFRQQRPGWELPIHQLLVKHGVTIFFQGHDHLFARQELDGVIYQTVPEPADPNYALHFPEAYRSGQLLPNSGRLRVSVSPDKVRVEYLRSWLPADITPEHPEGEVAFAYELPGGKSRR